MRTAVAAVDPALVERLTETRTRVAEAPVGREARVRIAVAAVFFAVAVPLALLAGTHRHAAWWLYLAFAVGTAVASSIEFEVGAGAAIPTELVLVPMLFTLPARVVPLVVLGGLALAGAREVATGDLSLSRAAVWAPLTSLFAVGPALVVVAAGEPRADLRGGAILGLAVAAQFAVDATVSSATQWLAHRVSPLELMGPLGWTFAIDALLAPLGFVAAVAARVEEAALLLPIPLAALLALFARERRDRLDSVLELSAAYRGTAFLLGDVVEADDAYTGHHSRQVVELSLEVADRLALGAHDRLLTELTALLHDVGKLRVPGEIINKPGPLTAEERAIVNTHTIEGERMLRRVGGLLADVGRIVRSCHERWDGSGYPDGLRGREIPLVASIVCACDAYNAMTTDRPYRRSLGRDAAVAELVANRGTQFEPDVVDALLAILGERREEPSAAAGSLLACPHCGHHAMLDAPVQERYRVCLRCGLVPIPVG